MSKRLLYSSSTREGGTLHTDLLEGVAQLALAVGSTLGPRGRNVIIDRHGETPLVTKDGVTVARNIQLVNPVHQAAAKLIQDVARDTVNEAGDGTTTATVLAHRMFEAGLELVGRGASPILLQRSILAAVDMISLVITKSAKVPTDEQIAQVATIATNGNAGIGELIMNAIKTVGRDGLITLDDSKTAATWCEVRDGFQFDSGWINPHFATDHARGTAILDNPLIFMTERTLSQGISQVPGVHDLGPLMTFAAGGDGSGSAREPRPLLIVADDVVGDALSSLLQNHPRFLQVCVVRAPGLGETRRMALADMALATGGKVLAADAGRSVSRWVVEDSGKKMTGDRLGTCKRAVISNGRTILEGCPGDAADPGMLERFAANLREQAKQMTDPLSREQMFQRAARLTGSVAVIRVGGNTEAEARALRDSVDDAVLATRAALAEGIVPGGGLCLFAMARLLRNTAEDLDPGVAQAGALLMARCLEWPMKQIAVNAGVDPGEVVEAVEAYAKDADGAFTRGYNAATDKYEDLMAAGIVDPAKVVRVALRKAASIAALMLTSSCLVYFDPDAVKAPLLPSPIPAAQRAE